MLKLVTLKGEKRESTVKRGQSGFNHHLYWNIVLETKDKRFLITDLNFLIVV